MNNIVIKVEDRSPSIHELCLCLIFARPDNLELDLKMAQPLYLSLGICQPNLNFVFLSLRQATERQEQCLMHLIIVMFVHYKVDKTQLIL